MTRTLLVAALLALSACAPKQAVLDAPVKVETEPEIKTVPTPPEVEDETAPPDDPAELDVIVPEEETLDPVQAAPEPDPDHVGPIQPHGN